MLHVEFPLQQCGWDTRTLRAASCWFQEMASTRCMRTVLGKTLEYCRHVALIHLSEADNQGNEMLIPHVETP